MVVVNQLLVELDGIDKHRQARVFVMGAKNRKYVIDEAFPRPVLRSLGSTR